MADTVDTFRRIASLLGKWLLLAALAIVVVVALVVAAAQGVQWYSHDRHAKQVDIFVSTEKEKCKDDTFPIYVMIGNGSSKVLEHTNFELAARMKGRSTNLVDSRLYSDDHIMDPNAGQASCWAVPTLKEAVADPRALEWSISYKSFRFRD